MIDGIELGEVIGRGGFGVVHEGRDVALDRPVAVKILNAPDEDAAARFCDEARLLARLMHPRIVQVYRAGVLSDGRPFLVMERFGQGSLDAHVPLGRRLPPARACHVVAQVLEALDAAHQAGVVHRDVKAANVLVDASLDEAKLCDFGVARAVVPMPNEAPATGRAVVGTPHVVAPERHLGRRADPRSDQWAAGALLLRLVTGRHPHDAPGLSHAEIARRIVEVPVERPGEAPGPVGDVLERLLNRDPSARFEDAGSARRAVLDAVRALQRAAPAAVEPTAPESPAPPARRRRWVIATVLGVATAAWTAATWPERAPIGDGVEPAAGSVQDAGVDAATRDTAAPRPMWDAGDGPVDAAAGRDDAAREAPVRRPTPRRSSGTRRQLSREPIRPGWDRGFVLPESDR